jgi:putative PIN family toxin of toxin-antitoxin system
LRCVFDTNVIVSALLLPDSKPRHAVDLTLQRGKILLSFAILAELYEVLSRKRFRRYCHEEDIRSFLAALTREARWVDVDVQIRACRDPQDDKFLELAGVVLQLTLSLAMLTYLRSILSRAFQFFLLNHFWNCRCLRAGTLSAGAPVTKWGI